MENTIETPVGTLTPAHFTPKRIRHQIVLDPKFLFALYYPQDRMHPVSKALLTFIQSGDLPYRRLIVNEHIIDETATRLKRKASLRNAETFLDTIDRSELFRLERVSGSVFDAAGQRFREWDDHGASFTEFVIAAQMEERELDYIGTYDQHFEAFDVTTVPYRS